MTTDGGLPFSEWLLLIGVGAAVLAAWFAFRSLGAKPPKDDEKR